MVSLEDTWDRIHTWLAANAPEVLDSLGPPATEEQLRTAESAMGVVLPAEVSACYRMHDGQRAALVPTGSRQPVWSVPPFLYGEEWLNLAGMVEHWRLMKGVLDRGAFRHPGIPRGPIRPDWWHPGWLPLTDDHSGDMKCLDLSPESGGRVGQIIYWCHDDPSRGVLAGSLTEWLADFADELELGEYTTAPDVYGPGLVRIGDL